MPYVISFVSQKGGVGKSTFARAVGVELIKAGYRVKVSDLDTQQGTFVEWHRRRLNNDISPRITSVESYKTCKNALASASDYDFLLLDGPARASKETLAIAKISDMIVQPSGASVDDLHPAILLFHELTENNVPTAKLFIALSRVGTEAEQAAANEYVNTAGYKTLDGAVFEKPSYRQAQNEGFTILETRYSNLKKKADLVIQNLFDQFQNLTEEK